MNLIKRSLIVHHTRSSEIKFFYFGAFHEKGQGASWIYNHAPANKKAFLEKKFTYCIVYPFITLNRSWAVLCSVVYQVLLTHSLKQSDAQLLFSVIKGYIEKVLTCFTLRLSLFPRLWLSNESTFRFHNKLLKRKGRFYQGI